MNKQSPLLKRLAWKKAELDEALAELMAAKQRVDRLTLEVSVWEEAVRLSGDGEASPSSDGETPARRSGATRRGPKGAWRKILSIAAASFPPPADFSLRDVEAIAATEGLHLTQDNVRSQMWNYGKSDVVEKTDIGRFRFTQAGLSLVADAEEMAAHNAPKTASTEPEQPAEQSRDASLV